MKYTLTVTKFIENPNYIEPKERYGYSQDFNTTNKFLDKTVLIVDVTEEEFTAIKKGVLEVIK